MTLYFILLKKVYKIWMLDFYYQLKMMGYKRFDNYRYVKFFFICYSRNRDAPTPKFSCFRTFITFRQEHCSINISDYDWPGQFDSFFCPRFHYSYKPYMLDRPRKPTFFHFLRKFQAWLQQKKQRLFQGDRQTLIRLVKIK